MLEFYLGSVIVWFIILMSFLHLSKDRIIRNGYFDATKESTKLEALIYAIAISAVPIFRVLVFIMVFLMAALTKNEFDELFKKDDENERSEQD